MQTQKHLSIWLAVAFFGYLFLGCESKPSKSGDYLGLNLNEAYPLQEAAGILQKNTGVEFEATPAGPNVLQGKNVTFAGKKWSRAEFTFGLDDRLTGVRFYQDYILDFNDPNNDPQIPKAYEEASELCEKLGAKYGDPAKKNDTALMWIVPGKGIIDVLVGSYVRVVDEPQGYENLLTVELGYKPEEPAEPDWGDGL